MAAGGCSGPCWQGVALWWIRLPILDRPYMCHLHAGAQQRRPTCSVAERRVVEPCQQAVTLACKAAPYWMASCFP